MCAYFRTTRTSNPDDYIKKTALKAVYFGDPTGIRTPVTAVKGRCPRPLDDGVISRDVYFIHFYYQKSKKFFAYFLFFYFYLILLTFINKNHLENQLHLSYLLLNIEYISYFK